MSHHHHSLHPIAGPSSYAASTSPKRFPPHLYVSVAAVHIFAGSTGPQGVTLVPMVARVSVVDYRGSILIDTHVRPTHYVQSLRFLETNIQLSDVVNALPFDEVRSQVASLIQGKIIIGHTLWTFLSIMGLSHPALETRDLALFRPLRRKLYSSRIIDLPTLVHIYMGRKIGLGVEDSLENARACIDLFRSCEVQFEDVIHAGAWPCDLPPTSYSQYFT